MIRSTVSEFYDRCIRQYGERTAITDGSRSFIYDELGTYGNAIASKLQGFGVAKGERIAFFMANCAEYIFCEYALAKIGATRVPLAVLLSSDDHVYMMNEAECTTLIYHESLSERVSKMLPELKTAMRFICVGGSGLEGHIPLSDLMIGGGTAPDKVDIDPEDIAGIYFTGGTTGRPKGVMLSHRSWAYTYLMEMLEYELHHGEVFLYATPLTHAGGCLILPVLLGGGRCVIMDRFEPEAFMQVVSSEGVTSTFLVPTMIYALLDHPANSDYDLPTLTNVIYGASAIAPDRLRQALDRYGPIFTQLFGQTEAPMTMTVLPRAEHVYGSPERQERVLSSAGRPTFHAEIRLLDDDGNDVPRGEAGEIVVRCTNMMSGYLNNPEATSETIRDGWLYTGDIAMFDEEGYVYIVDRKKDMIVSGGFNVYPREVEDVLHEHPGVRNVAVVGVPDDKWGEAVCAVVEVQENCAVSPDELIGFVKERKGSLVAPKRIDFWDSVPLTNLGKLDKKAIRQHYWQGQTRKV